MSNLEELSVEQLRELAVKAQAYEPAYKLVQTMASDPEARAAIQRWHKKRNPNASIPELDQEDRLMAKLAEETRAREALEEKLRLEKITRDMEAERAQVKERYKLSEEDLKAIEKRMIKSDDNPDPLPPRYDWAASLYVASRTPSTPTPSSFMPPTLTMPDGKTWGKGIGNPAELNRIALDKAFEAFNEIRGGRVAQ